MCFFCQSTEFLKLIKENYFIGYIDPGSGYVFNSILPYVIGFISALLTSALFLLRKIIYPFLKRKKRWILITLLLVLVGFIVLFIKNMDLQENSLNKKIVILGVDGFDPNLIEQGIQKNLLPNLSYLKNNGYYSILETVTPPQSPVAWASFATGTAPAHHGIYDFIIRHPSTYRLDLVWSERSPNLLKTDTFWQIALKKNIPTKVLFLPNTFPPTKLKGEMISGMGTPDVLGTAGKYTLFTTGKINLKSRGTQIQIKNDKFITTNILGPKYNAFNQRKTAIIPLKIEKNPKNKSVILVVEDQKIFLKEGSFSNWMKFDFRIDFFTNIFGIGKFYLKKVDSQSLELYLSPISFDPEKPIKQISYPDKYSQYLSREYGLFNTQGLPCDTWAYEEGVLNEKAFLQSINSIFAERSKIYLGELKKFKSGIFFNYIGLTDTSSHMFWSKQNIILDHYRQVDELIGKTRKQLNKNDVLIILSDHGFANFDFEFNLNSWLRDNGYLYLKKGDTSKELFDNIDWKKTNAYALGYNGIYFNILGREKEGKVTESDIPILEKELRNKLLNAVNSYTGQKIIKKIYFKKDLKIDKNDETAPDIFVGYYRGIRSSWNNAVGAVDKDIVSKRISKWSGDHLFDASEVPGVLFINNKINFKNPKITDVVSIIFNFK